MKTTNYFHKSFGPAASFSGIVIFIAGLISVFYNLMGVSLIILGAFVGFTHSGTTIDFTNRRVKQFNNLFGIFRTGKWITIEKNMMLGFRQSKRNYRTYSRSNRVLDIQEKGKEILLLDRFGKPFIKLKELAKAENPAGELEKMSNLLGLEILHATRK